MSEINLEAESGKTSGEDPQLDSKVEEERLADDVRQESVDGNLGEDDPDGAMYEIDIDSAEDSIETSFKGLRGSDKGGEPVLTCEDGEAARTSSSVDNGGLEADRHAERAPEESGEAHAETKVIFSLILDNQPFQAAPCCALLLM